MSGKPAEPARGTVSSDGYGCVVCRRPLNRYRNPDGTISYQHPHVAGRVDHAPVPQRADRIRGGLIASCDFCTAEGVNAWLLETSTEIALVASGPDASLVNNYGTRWASCPLCADLAAATDIDRLHAQSLATSGLPRRDPAAVTARRMMAATLTALKPGPTLLLDGTTGPMPVLSPPLLPKIRDRLTTLLDHNTIPALAGTGRQAVIAEGLRVARLYVIDTDYTDMAIALAASVAGATVTAPDLPGPYGLLTWPHPINDDGVVAMSWAVDGSTVHLTAYRPLATTITGAQLQRLREQAGWLLPLRTRTLALDQPLAAGQTAAVLVATWLLIGHRLTESLPVPLDPTVRKAYARTARPAPDVRLIRLQPSHKAAAEDSGTQVPRQRQTSDHRWWVTAHIRNQPHGPGRTLRRPILVLPFVNGPRGKPVKADTTVRILGKLPSQPKVNPAG